MLQKFQKHIANHFYFLEQKKILVAVSSGIDSVVLTHLMVRLNTSNIALAHCNFKLRGLESDSDEQFVKNLAKKLNVQIFTTLFETKEFAKKNKLSTQVAARELRYNWFQKLIEKHNFDYVLTAHNANDNLETFLINLTRGTGLDGLTGIPEIANTVVRPLLIFSRKEIFNFAKKNNIEWREDSSNLETKYTRNKIRHHIIPKLEEINSSLLKNFENTVAYLKESQQIIEDRIKEVTKTIQSTHPNKNYLQFSINKIQQLSNPKAYLYQILKPYGFTEWDDVFLLLTAQSGKQVFSKTHRLLKDREFLLLSKITTADSSKYTINDSQTKVTTPISLSLINTAIKDVENQQTIYVDKDLLKFPLIVRKWQKGDYFYPKGMQGKKKLSKYFKDEKISLIEKENTWLLCSNNCIVWVIEKRQDNRFLATKSSKNILKISLLK
ncbi:tRNA lysidine(34) synthetase TilS [Tenacibaculum sp. UWU-22]|uniref:tRNA lysidine(34) synthetase TilS n=1 Tax=Tenacibaculum sp. UWU-22 TaxID=3234187 RepID=UPI0034DB2A3E